MRFLVDNQLPVALARWLAGAGEQADHVCDLGLERAGDSEIWAFSMAKERIVVSKDVDFLLLANRPADTARLLWVRVGNCRPPALLTRFVDTWTAIQGAFASGQRVVELR